MFPFSETLQRLCLKLLAVNWPLTLTLSPLSPSSGWKLNPVVGAVYAPELYAGKLFFSSVLSPLPPPRPGSPL